MDLVEAADRAVLAGDAHGARRALAELRERLARVQLDDIEKRRQ